MYFGDLFLTRGRLPLSSFLCFVGGFSMGSWLTLFHQLQAEKDLAEGHSRIITPNEQETLLLLTVLIVSAPVNIRLRTTIRSTWLKLYPSTSNVKHFFLIGTKGLSSDAKRRLYVEAEADRDLLLLHDLQDSYQNLTRKVFQGLTSISKNVPSNYVLKCDDDSFVRLDKIVQELEERDEIIKKNSKDVANGNCFYWGYFDGRAPVQRKGKWKETDPYILCDTYVPYAIGGGYILSKPCLDFIRTNQEVLKPYMNEDVTIGTWLSTILVERKHDERFDTQWESRGCSNQYLIQHKLSEIEMMEKYTTLLNQGQLCKEESQKRYGWIYNWDVPPSQCCRSNISVI